MRRCVTTDVVLLDEEMTVCLVTANNVGQDRRKDVSSGGWNGNVEKFGPTKGRERTGHTKDRRSQCLPTI